MAPNTAATATTKPRRSFTKTPIAVEPSERQTPASKCGERRRDSRCSSEILANGGNRMGSRFSKGLRARTLTSPTPSLNLAGDQCARLCARPSPNKVRCIATLAVETASNAPSPCPLTRRGEGPETDSTHDPGSIKDHWRADGCEGRPWTD